MTEDIRHLAERNPSGAARHADCAPDLWLELAKEHPMEALENPSRLLFALEDPMLYGWEVLEREYVEHWIGLLLPTLAEREQQLWAADCAERVLPLFEREYPNDRRPRTAIQVRRDFALGRADKVQWDAAQFAARDAARDAAGVARAARSAAGSAAGSATGSAARDAARAAARDAAGDAARAAWDAAWAAAGSAAGSAVRSAAWDAAWDAERVWQWRRLLEYLT